MKQNSAKLNVPEILEKKDSEEQELNDQLNSNKRTEEGSPLKNLLNRLGSKNPKDENNTMNIKED